MSLFKQPLQGDFDVSKKDATSDTEHNHQMALARDLAELIYNQKLKSKDPQFVQYVAGHILQLAKQSRA